MYNNNEYYSCIIEIKDSYLKSKKEYKDFTLYSIDNNISDKYKNLLNLTNQELINEYCNLLNIKNDNFKILYKYSIY
jgi:hypothetical protein